MLFDDTLSPKAGKRRFFRFIHYLFELNHVIHPPWQNYDQYHERYLKWDCDKQHNTAYFDKCCHPLLVGLRVVILAPYSHTTQKGEPMSVLDELHCEDGCFDDESPVTLTATSTSSSQPAHADASPTYPPKKPVSGALGKVNDSPPPPPSSSTTTTSTPPKAAASPPPAQTSSSSSGGGDVHKGGLYVPWSLLLLIYSVCLPSATFYYQKGIAGSCGTVHSDDDFICALRECSLERH